jgi:hypothetical protein
MKVGTSSFMDNHATVSNLLFSLKEEVDHTKLFTLVQPFSFLSALVTHISGVAHCLPSVTQGPKLYLFHWLAQTLLYVLNLKYHGTIMYFLQELRITVTCNALRKYPRKIKHWSIGGSNQKTTQYKIYRNHLVNKDSATISIQRPYKPLKLTTVKNN